MNKNNEHISTEDIALLSRYMELEDPVKQVFRCSLVLIFVSALAYFLLGFLLPDNPELLKPLVVELQIDYKTYEAGVKRFLEVPDEQRWNRLTMLCYLSLYCGMWWAYFASKVSNDEEVEKKRLKIQTLRRLLGYTAKQWQPQITNSTEDNEVVETFRRKGTAGMEVIAILMAVSILIFDQISNIWMSSELSDANFSLWQYSILWVGMSCAVVSFICFMMCVDALDTMFNSFSSSPVRNVLVKYFYDYTINPRYVATATMLLSIILLLGYHSEVLASMAVAVTIWVGSKLWFPDIRDYAVEFGYSNEVTRRVNFRWYYILLLLPLAVKATTYLLYA